MDDFIHRIEQTGVKILRNKSVCYNRNSTCYQIIGIDDLRGNRHDISRALEIKDCKPILKIAFTHNPDMALEMPGDSVDYLLAGHFHGGQIWMPFNMEYKVLRNDKLSRMGIQRGLHRVNGINLYINRGLGNVLFPLRFLSRPEITVFYFP